MMRPLVSVVTGTWDRHDLLLETIENVRQQTYPNIEHVIVSDGPDDDLYFKVKKARNEDSPEAANIPIRFVELGFQSTEFFGDSPSAAPFKVAQFLARGEYQMWLADDERMLVPDYIERMVNTLEEGFDFAYSYVTCYWVGRPQSPWTIGTDPPQHGQITSSFYRRELLKHRMFELHVGAATDWDMINHWMQAGARWKLIPEVLFNHRVDK